jgi:excisionase family DNA binding protein
MERIQMQIGITLDEQAVATFVGLMRKACYEPSVEDQKREARLHASRNALFAGEKPPEDKGLLINSREAAKLLKVSERTLWRMWNHGEMPRPIHIGHAVRWSYEGLKAWVSAGCPRAQNWKWPK